MKLEAGCLVFSNFMQVFGLQPRTASPLLNPTSGSQKQSKENEQGLQVAIADHLAGISKLVQSMRVRRAVL